MKVSEPIVTERSSVMVRFAVIAVPRVTDRPIVSGTVAGDQLVAVPQLPFALRVQVWADAGATSPAVAASVSPAIR